MNKELSQHIQIILDKIQENNNDSIIVQLQKLSDKSFVLRVLDNIEQSNGRVDPIINKSFQYSFRYNNIIENTEMFEQYFTQLEKYLGEYYIVMDGIDCYDWRFVNGENKPLITHDNN